MNYELLIQNLQLLTPQRHLLQRGGSRPRDWLRNAVAPPNSIDQ
ncbi:hypothetical protein [Dendronalium sp. ChiSLP03b]|nr:hypothetical protein [Dendronalium sp. ChiSLP03b]MDZ8207618.1 hypothetical protein [Dendronalium sp. ChiSLP03b]